MLLGLATPEATERYAAQFASRPGFYRDAQGLRLSSIGIGTYLGGLDPETTRSYADAVKDAVRGGINVIDTSLNYRHQRSEQAIGMAIMELAGAREIDRNQLVVCTKAGYLVKNALPAGLRAEDVAGGQHSMAPDFLADQLERSRVNLAIETIDVFYLHNPETQMSEFGAEAFYGRVRRAFEAMERFTSEGRIRHYGAATWSGFRQKGGLSLERMVALAREVAGDSHRFRFVQLPFNLAMREAVSAATQPLEGRMAAMTEAAAALGVTLVASASILQAKLARGLPAELGGSIAGLRTDAQRALQFARSAPGITTALVGMSKPAHVAENLEVGEQTPLDPQRFASVLSLVQ